MLANQVISASLQRTQTVSTERYVMRPARIVTYTRRLTVRQHHAPSVLVAVGLGARSHCDVIHIKSSMR